MAEKKPFKFPSLTEVIGAVIFSLIIMQVVSFVISQIFGVTQLKLGPAFLIIGAGLAVYAAYGFIRRYVSEAGFDKLSFLQFLIITAIVVAMYIYLPKLVPQIFTQSMLELRDLFGIQ